MSFKTRIMFMVQFFGLALISGSDLFFSLGVSWYIVFILKPLLKFIWENRGL